jgi:hypothetical protein
MSEAPSAACSPGLIQKALERRVLRSDINTVQHQPHVAKDRSYKVARCCFRSGCLEGGDEPDSACRRSMCTCMKSSLSRNRSRRQAAPESRGGCTRPPSCSRDWEQEEEKVQSSGFMMLSLDTLALWHVVTVHVLMNLLTACNSTCHHTHLLARAIVLSRPKCQQRGVTCSSVSTVRQSTLAIGMHKRLLLQLWR